GMRLAPRDKQHISRCHLNLLVRCLTRVDLCPISYFDGIRHLRLPDAPLLFSMNLHDQHVHEVPMWLECTTLEKAQVGIHVCVNSHLSLNGCGKLTDLRNPAVDGVHDDADALREQVVKSADVELLAFVRRVQLPCDSHAIPHYLYVLVKRMVGEQSIDIRPREQRLRPSGVGCCDMESFSAAERFEEFGGRNRREQVRKCSQHWFAFD